MGAIIRDPKDNRRVARVGTPGDGENLGDGLVTNAIGWLTEPISGIRRLWRGSSEGHAYVTTPPGKFYELLAAATHAVAGTFYTPYVTGMSAFKRLIFVLAVTNADTAAGDTLDVYVDFSIDQGVSWLNAVHFTQVVGTDAAATEVAVLDPADPGAVVIAVTSDAASGVTRPAVWGDWVRVRYVLVNVTAVSYTFGVKMMGQY